MMNKSVNVIKLTTALFFIAAGVILLHSSFADRGLLFALDEGLDPMIYPRCLLVGWLFCSVLYLLMPQERFQPASLKKSLPGLISVIAVIAVYIFLFSQLGLVFSTFIFMLLFDFVMGNRKIFRSILSACIFTLITWLIFEVLLGIPMPGNILMELFFKG